MTETLVVNFYGGPGTGKSTVTAHAYALLKWAGYNCEMAREYAKDKVWEGSIDVLDDQIHVFGEQYHRLHILQDKVDIILTDSPIILGLVYAETTKLPYVSFENLVMDTYNDMNNLNIVLNRIKDFEQAGRIQKVGKAIEIDHEIIDLLESNSVPYFIFDASPEYVYDIVELIINTMSDKNAHTKM